MEVFQVQNNHLCYEWNDVALLEDQRACTIICKTMFKIPQQNILEIQDVALVDWTWQNEFVGNDLQKSAMTPFQGIATLQIYYLNQEAQQESFLVDVPIHGAWQKPVIEQNCMQLLFYHAKMAGEQLLLETVLQIMYNQSLEHSQVLIGPFQMDELLTLEKPWPSCDAILTTSVLLDVQEWTITKQQLLLNGTYQIVCVYQNSQQPGEQVFVYEQRSPMEATLLIPEGVQDLTGIMPYFQNITAELLDPMHVQIVGSGVFCTFPIKADMYIADCEETEETIGAQNHIWDPTLARKESSPSVVNRRGSRRANLSKYMRDLNNSVESPSSVRNIEISVENDWSD